MPAARIPRTQPARAPASKQIWVTRWLANGCLRTQRLEQPVVGDQRVAFRVAADADADERVREPRELLEQVAGVGVDARRRVGVAADHEDLA